MGKTTILFHLLEKFRSSARTAFVFQTQCTSREFMRFLLVELGYEGDTQDFVKMHEEFNKRLLQEARAGNRFIVVIDEAQNLEPSVLETVRLLSDFETPRAKLLQIILAGQPELAEKLSKPSLAQLRQRVSIVNRLEPLSTWEIKHYIEHRMKVAGYSGDPVFTDDALAQIARFTEGIPRNVNNFCFNALSLACALRQKKVDLGVAQEVISDLDISKHLTADTLAPVNADLPSQVFSPPAPPVVVAPPPPPVAPAPVPERPKAVELNETLSPAEARSYMQQMAAKIRNWQQGAPAPANDEVGRGSS